MRADAVAWLIRCGIEPTPRRASLTNRILDHQSPKTVPAISRTMLEETSLPEYLAAVRRVIAQGIELHLIAGEKSAVNRDVPAFVRDAATSYHTIDRAAHLMMPEEPDAFCESINRIAQGE